MRASDFTPRETVGELDRYIIGQSKAKRAVAIAMRNRWRRQQVPEDLRDEIMPKNIIMVGPTGVGKTEIARRLAKLAQAPFLKIEASKFTEVGYVGRDVESIVRDLVEVSISLVREEERERVQARAREHAEERLLDMLDGGAGGSNGGAELAQRGAFVVGSAGEARRATGTDSRERLRERLRAGELDDETVEIEQTESMSPMVSVLGGAGLEDMEIRLKEMLGNLPGMSGMRGQPQQRKVKVPDALQLFEEEETSKLIDADATKQAAIERAEQSGIVFIDEIDKIAGARRESGTADVSREGVQRDLLPIVEGSTVSTRHGPVRTDHVLFIAAGAFHVSKVSDLIPELQGRFPIRVELDSLDEADFVRILTEPRNSLTKQYVALMQTEDVTLEFTPAAIEAVARAAAEANRTAENIGARRLHTVMEALLDPLSFDAPERGGERIVIDAVDVTRVLDPLLADQDLARFIL